MLKYILVISLAFLLSACSSDEQANSLSSSVEEGTQNSSLVSSHQPAHLKLVFFLDPNGGPCRMQATILNDMAKELSEKVDIQYVQTTVPTDREIFYQYGIRALPTLLLADASGKEIKRIPPGVKDQNQIRSLIDFNPKS